MKDRAAWQALKIALYIMIAIAALALLIGCQTTASRKPIEINGYIHCIPTPESTVLCQVHLKEKMDDI